MYPSNFSPLSCKGEEKWEGAFEVRWRCKKGKLEQEKTREQVHLGEVSNIIDIPARFGFEAFEDPVLMCLGTVSGMGGVENRGLGE